MKFTVKLELETEIEAADWAVAEDVADAMANDFRRAGASKTTVKEIREKK